MSDITKVLPKEILIHILSFLSPHQLITMESVSHLLRELAAENQLWGKVLETEGIPSLLSQYPHLKELGYKEAYKQLFLLFVNLRTVVLYHREYPEAKIGLPSLEECEKRLSSLTQEKNQIAPKNNKKNTWFREFKFFSKKAVLEESNVSITKLAGVCLKGNENEIQAIAKNLAPQWLNDIRIISLFLTFSLHNKNEQSITTLLLIIPRKYIIYLCNSLLKNVSENEYLLLMLQKYIPEIVDEVIRKMAPEGLNAQALKWLMAILTRYDQILMTSIFEHFGEIQQFLIRDILSWRDNANNNILHELVTRTVNSTSNAENKLKLISYFVKNYPQLKELKNNSGETPFIAGMAAYENISSNNLMVRKGLLSVDPKLFPFYKIVPLLINQIEINEMGVRFIKLIIRDSSPQIIEDLFQTGLTLSQEVWKSFRMTINLIKSSKKRAEFEEIFQKCYPRSTVDLPQRIRCKSQSNSSQAALLTQLGIISGANELPLTTRDKAHSTNISEIQSDDELNKHDLPIFLDQLL